MNIVFYGNHPHWGGLANNGGTRTVLLSAKELRSLGHRVDIVACVDRFSWFAHPAVLKKVLMDTQVIIAISISDVKEIYKKFPDKKLAYWARPFETWQKSEDKCIRLLRKFQDKYSGIIMVNSVWQEKELAKHGIKSHIVLSGQELHYKEYHAERDPNFKLTIGCQYSTKPRKGWEAFKKLARTCPEYEYVAFGSEKCRDNFLTNYLRNPIRQELNGLYRNMDIFFVPNTFEGFYNCGVEASLQGCLLVVGNHPRNGVWDYCNEENCHVYERLEEVPEILELPEFERVSLNQESIYKNIPTRNEAMKRMINVLN